VRKFVHEVGPRGLESQLRGAQEEAVRAVARSMEHTEVPRLLQSHVQNSLSKCVKVIRYKILPFV
jgi:hypothetical protein